MQPFDTTLIPRLDSYKSVQDRFENTKKRKQDESNHVRLCDWGDKGVEGREDSIKADRARGVRQSHKQLAKLGDSGQYAATLYDSQLVKFYPTHYEISLADYVSRSTIQFIEKITGFRLVTYDADKDCPADYLTHFEGTEPVLKHIDAKHYLFHDELAELLFDEKRKTREIKYTAVPLAKACRGIPCGGGAVLINSEDWYAFEYGTNAPKSNNFVQRFRYKVNRSKINNVRKGLQDLTNYLKTTFKMQSIDNENKKVQVTPLKDGNKDKIKIESNYFLLFEYIANPTNFSSDKFHDLYTALLYANASNCSDGEAMCFNNSFMADYNRIIKQTHAEVLDRVV